MTCASNFSCWRGRTILGWKFESSLNGFHSKKKNELDTPKIWDYSLFFKDWVQISKVRVSKIKSTFVVSDDSKFLELGKAVRGHWSLFAFMKVSGPSFHCLLSSTNVAGLSPSWGVCRVGSIQQEHITLAAQLWSSRRLLTAVSGYWGNLTPVCCSSVPGLEALGLLDCLTALWWEHPEETRWLCSPRWLGLIGISAAVTDQADSVSRLSLMSRWCHTVRAQEGDVVPPFWKSVTISLLAVCTFSHSLPFSRGLQMPVLGALSIQVDIGKPLSSS